MADSLLFASYRSVVLKRIDAVFPDRGAQLKELSRIASSTPNDPKPSTPPNAFEARILLDLLQVLRSWQLMTQAPTRTDEIQEQLTRISQIFAGLDKDSLSSLVQDQLLSIATHFSAYSACLLVFIVHMYIYRHSAELEQTIQHWHARSAEHWRWWHLLEKTPFFWARYFRLIKVPHQLLHPQLEVNIRLAWLKRLRLGLQYFLGKSQHYIAQVTLNTPEEVETLTVELLNEIVNLNRALSSAFVIPGLSFEKDALSGLKASLIDDSAVPRLLSTSRLANSSLFTSSLGMRSSLRASTLQSLPVAFNTHPVQHMVVENLDASMVISAPTVDELLSSYKAIEREVSAVPLLASSVAPQTSEGATSGDPLAATSSGAKEESGKEVVLDADPLFKARRDFLETICASVRSTIRICHTKMGQNGVPPFYERQWMVCAGVGAVTCLGAWRLFKNWNWLKSQAIETKNGISRFLYDHAVTPIVSIYKTIRYDDTEVSVMSKQNLDEDVESLVRMVKDFHMDKHGPSSSEILERLSTEARSGVIPSIMTAYESEIPHPIANALAGDLLRLALIQVQKQKVDIEKAMAQLDRLLKQNEINFQLMALFPVILATAGLTILSTQSTRDPYKRQHATLRSLLRKVAMHINKSSLDEKVQTLDFLPSTGPAASSLDSSPWGTSSIPKLGPPSPRGASAATSSSQGNAFTGSGLGDTSQTSQALPSLSSSLTMNHEDYGLLLCLSSQLLVVGSTLPWQERMGFIEDVLEITKCHFSARQRLATIQRMYTNYNFLSASQ